MNKTHLTDSLIDTPDLVRESRNFRYGTNAIKDESEKQISYRNEHGIWIGKPINRVWFYVLGTFGVLMFVFALFLFIADRTMGVHLGVLK